MPPIVRRKPSLTRIVGASRCASTNIYRITRRAWRAIPLLMLWVLAGCIPARDVPSQLSATAAPAYSVFGDTLITDIYTVTLPKGWRIIAGPAEDPYTFQFISPDNTALIMVSNRQLTVESLPIPAALELERHEVATSIQSVIKSDTSIALYAGYISHPAQAEMMAIELQQILDSLR